VTCAGNSGGRRNGVCRDSVRETVLSGNDGGGDRSGRMTGVVSGFWGSAGLAMTNQVAREKSLKILPLSLANFAAKAISQLRLDICVRHPALGGTCFRTSHSSVAPVNSSWDARKHVPPRSLRPVNHNRDCP
jgi:hypothetical protein